MEKTKKNRTSQLEFPSKSDKRYLKILVFSMLVVSLLFTRFDDRLFAGGDDNDYFATATSIAYLQFPIFKNEDLSGNNAFGKTQLPYATGFGPGILASPFVFVGSIIDRILSAPFKQPRI